MTTSFSKPAMPDTRASQISAMPPVASSARRSYLPKRVELDMREAAAPQTSMISASFFPASSSTFSMPLSMTAWTSLVPFC